MSTARLKVNFAGPLVSYQDAGRPGHMRFGVAGSGPMDRFAHDAAMEALHQPRGGTAIEVSLGGLVLECVSGEVSFAVTGGSFSVNGQDQGWQVQTLRAGETLSIRAGSWGSWAYLAFAGQLDAQDWLGQTATHSMSGFGGGMLTAGDLIQIRDAQTLPERLGPLICPSFAKPDGQVRVVIGPQDRFFLTDAVEAFFTQSFALSEAFDRMGVRLKGPKLTLADALSIPSEPLVRGSVQVAGDGVPTVLLADHGTTGGYPKLATVISCDFDRFVQMRAGEKLRFTRVSAEQALTASRSHHAAKEAALAEIAAPKFSLDERLMRENLIGGTVGNWPE